MLGCCRTAHHLYPGNISCIHLVFLLYSYSLYHTKQTPNLSLSLRLCTPSPIRLSPQYGKPLSPSKKPRNVRILKNTKYVRKCQVPPLLAASTALPSVVRFGYYDNGSGSRKEKEGLFQAEADREREERDSD